MKNFNNLDLPLLGKLRLKYEGESIFRVEPNVKKQRIGLSFLKNLFYKKNLRFIELETLSCKRKAGLLSLCQV
ncbi:hypothetical protein GCM10008013_37390 [Paenibacillus segetis]|uniref:N-acetyltransferase domain-containing protein n=1 Tax=Paenibacillus segetis TaxID=1325360 RepID=A0ABQ1YNI8_9BACL|nr:hypothetical protein GCM10008013_37390 [Paenibacillus segetis]